MFRNYLAAALRNLIRNGAYAAINILGLAIGFAAVILIALFVRDEYSYDRFFPDHARTYLITETVSIPGEAPLRIAVTAANIAPAMKLDFPEIDAAVRLSGTQIVIQQGGSRQSQQVYCADEGFFSVFPMKVIAGNPDETLRSPDGLVLTRKVARRYFGREDVVGQTLEVNRQDTLRVGAVIEDLPSNTHLEAEMFASAKARFSSLSTDEEIPADRIRPETSYTYVRLRAGADVSRLVAAMGDFALRHVPGEFAGVRVAKAYRFNFIPLAAIHLQPTSIADMKPPSDPRTVETLVGIAVLILLVAASNFVSMMTARAAGRAVEVGVRKATGATRSQIIAQFLGECLFYAFLALTLAMVAVELVVPAVNGFLHRDIVFDWFRDSILAGAIVAVWLITGLAAGAYAAIVLSAFRPGMVFKGATYLPGGSGRLRQILVVCQFGTLIALIVATVTIHRQTHYAMQERLRMPTEEIHLVSSGCPEAFKDGVTRIPGVRATTCASGESLDYGRSSLVFESLRGSPIGVKSAPVDYGFFEVFGIQALAGRLFKPNRGEDDMLRADPKTQMNPSSLRAPCSGPT